MIRALAVHAVLSVVLCGVAAASQQGKSLRVGYLDASGSALVLVAETRGYFDREGLSVALVRYTRSIDLLNALVSGRIEAGTLSAEEALRAVSSGKEFRVIAGGGTPKGAEELLKELDPSLPAQLRASEIVMVGTDKLDKITAIRTVAALIRAHVDLSHNEPATWQTIGRKLTQAPEAGSLRFDPNPDFYRFESLWVELKLQRSRMTRDYLARHVDEEVYCDALDRLLDAGDLDDPVLRQLSRTALCIPDCCPNNSGTLTTLKGGVTP